MRNLFCARRILSVYSFASNVNYFWLRLGYPIRRAVELARNTL